jgi:predicted transposase YbfD/YdcC
MNQSIKSYFEQIEDFRQAKKCKHRLSDILLIGICTYLCNGQDYEDMVLFGHAKGPSLVDLLELPNGVPSHDTFNRVFQLLNPELLRQCLSQHGNTLLKVLADKQIALDGKKLRGVTPHSKGTSGLFIVNAWVGENRLCVGQHKVEDKSNEIEALSPLIAQLDITDAVVSIDAIGCQKELAKQIKQQQGHYLLAVKANQKALLEEIECAFKACRPQAVRSSGSMPEADLKRAVALFYRQLPVLTLPILSLGVVYKR